MRMTPVMTASMLLALAPGAACAADPAIQPGLWEITITTQVPGAPTPQQHTTQHCIDKENAANMQNMAPLPGADAKCRKTDSRQSGNRYTYTMQCDQPKLVSSGEIVVTSTGYQGNMNTEINEPGTGKMQFAQQFSARRVGDCK